MPLAYLIATVVTGLGLLIAHTLYAASRTVRPTIGPSPLSSLLSPLLRRPNHRHGRLQVGRREIRNHKSEIQAISKSPNLQISKSLVSLGDKFAFSSGLMEITYNTGAKVILQGPGTYEVDS